MHINILIIHTSHFIMWQDYRNAFINTTSFRLMHIRERLAAFIVSQVISPNGEFHFSI
jgi:hypothetical protein